MHGKALKKHNGLYCLWGFFVDFEVICFDFDFGNLVFGTTFINLGILVVDFGWSCRSESQESDGRDGVAGTIVRSDLDALYFFEVDTN